ncbi:MAG: synthase subunit delta [Microbacteriaceae bacterium]|jgi:F-type H+-transporting ATPase subunit delta|nr:synthase subunit delta [Microbacteriaceae bacterium]
MGSATREAIGAATAVLATQTKVELATGEQLLDAALVIEREARLRAALADDSAEPADRVSIVGAVFGKYSAAARAVLESLVTSRWSSSDDLVGGIEQLGIRAVAASAPKTLSISDELFVLATAVGSNPELELALGSKLGSTDGKISLVDSLLEGKASKQTIAIVGALLAQPRGRRFGELVRYATGIVAEQAGYSVATVTVATPLAAAQATRLEKALSNQYGGGVRINQVVDPSILGGMRVQVGDDVIDGTIAGRLADLRLRLVG